MTYGLHLVAKDATVGDEESVYSRIEVNRHVPVIDIVESLYGVEYLLLCVLIPRTLDALGVHAVSEIEGRRNIDVFGQIESGLDRYGVHPAVAPFASEIGLEDTVFLGVDSVGDAFLRLKG